MKKAACIAAAVAAVITAGAYFRLSISDRAPADRNDIISDISPEDICRITSERADEKWSIYTDGEAWTTDGIKKSIVGDYVDACLVSIFPLHGKMLNSVSDSSDYGFESGESVLLSFETNDGKKIQITVGDNTPSETETYILVGGDVYTVYTEVSSAMRKRLYNFLDPYIGGYDINSIQGIKIVRRDGIYELKRRGGRWVDADGEATDAEAVQTEITRYLRSMYFLKCFNDAEENPEKYGFSENSPFIDITMQDGTTSRITAGKTDGEEMYITVDGDGLVYSVLASNFKYLSQ